jgi:ATP-dependent helicase/DNAse subunit B
MLMDEAVGKAGELCERMRDGETEASPGEDSAGSVCRYCDYRAICRRAGKKIRTDDSGEPGQQAEGKNTLRESEKQRIMSEEKTP